MEQVGNEEIQNMNVGQIDFTDGFQSEKGESKDWNLALLHATFQHKEACEFIFYIGSESDSHSTVILNLIEKGFSKLFTDAIEEAQYDGFNYLNFYA